MNGALLRQWMKENKIRAEELAIKIGVSYASIRNYMAGKPTNRPTITVLAGLMGVSEEELLIHHNKDPIGRKKPTR